MGQYLYMSKCMVILQWIKDGHVQKSLLKEGICFKITCSTEVRSYSIYFLLLYLVV